MSEGRRTVIITGASRGIGHSTARMFLDRGWKIITCSRDETPEECKRDPNWTVHIPTDLSDSDSIATFIKEATKVLGNDPLHGLVNNAGVSPKSEHKERLGCLNGDLEAWQDVFELNLFAPLKLSRGFASALHKGGGAIVNITSIAGHSIHPFAGSAYSISKAALSGLTREMANEFASLGVRVNAVSPGEIENCLEDHPQIEEAAVIGVPDTEWGEVVKAILVLKPDAKMTQEEVTEYCKSNLASFKAPQYIGIVKLNVFLI